MWRFVVFTAVLQTMSVSSRVIQSPEMPLLPSQDNVVRELVRQLRSSNSDDVSKQRYSPYQLLYSEGDNLDRVYLQPQQDKRSFAMLAHWGALSNIGKQRSPIREVPSRWRSVADANAISAETRARSGGQPLRWG